MQHKTDVNNKQTGEMSIIDHLLIYNNGTLALGYLIYTKLSSINDGSDANLRSLYPLDSQNHNTTTSKTI